MDTITDLDKTPIEEYMEAKEDPKGHNAQL
jgi:hypothetical protein